MHLDASMEAEMGLWEERESVWKERKGKYRRGKKGNPRKS
jgi:hypothetical protein